MTFAASMGVLAVCFDDTDNKARNLKGYILKACEYLWQGSQEKIVETPIKKIEE